MLKAIITIMIGLIVLILMGGNLLGILKGFKPSNSFKFTKRTKGIIIISIGIIGLLFGAFFLFRLLVFSSGNNSNIANYYMNPEYWHLYSHFRNKQITKIYKPLYGPMAIYGGWSKIEQVTYNVQETPNGFKPIKESSRLTFQNDSILITTFKSESDIIFGKYYFNNQSKLERIEEKSQSYGWVNIYDYDFDANGNFREFTHYRKDTIVERHVVTVAEGENYTISLRNAQGEIYRELVYKLERNGLPSECEIKEDITIKNVLYFDVKEIQHFNIQGSEKITVSNFTQEEGELKTVNGKGLQILLHQPDWKGEDSDKYETKLHFESTDNWLAAIHYKNDMVTQISLRKITYQDGFSEGTIDANAIENL